MIRIAAIAAALAALAVPASAAVADGLAAPYLHIQVALANDSTSGVAEAARAISAEAAGMGEQAAAIGAAAEALAAATDLQSARDAFGPLSDALIVYGRDVGFGRAAPRLLPDGRQGVAAGDQRDPESLLRLDDADCGEFR